MVDKVRYLRADRSQLRWDMVDLESQLPLDHRARVVWAFVESLDLSRLYAGIKALAHEAGRPPVDPAILLALWLYATLEGVGSARALDRMCRSDTACRWLCGGVPMNYHGLSDFRVAHGAVLDRLLSESLAALMAEGVVTLAEVAVDGTKLRASAGRGSYRKAAGLAAYEQAARQRVGRLRAEVDSDPGASERRRQAAVERAGREALERAAAARRSLERLRREKAERARSHAKDEDKKADPKASTTDPEARFMKFADGATRPGYNLLLAAAPDHGLILGVEVTDRRNDAGLAVPMVEQLESRYDDVPGRLLLDSNIATQDDIVTLAAHPTAPVEVYAPPPAERDDVSPAWHRRRARRRRQEPPALQDWRTRMASAQGQETYQRRKRIETVNGNLKNRGLGQLPVRGIAKVRCIALLHALAHNLWRAHTLRLAAA